MWEYSKNRYRAGEYLIKKADDTPPMLFVSTAHSARFITEKLNELERLKRAENA